MVAIWPLIISLTALFGVNALSTWLSMGARATVSAESHWSKSRHRASDALQHFIDTGDRRDYASFRGYLEAPLSLRRAREALTASPPDNDAGRTAFVAGGAHPDDVAPMIWLLQHAYLDAGAMRTLDIWLQSDREIDALIGLGAEALALRSRASPSATAIEDLQSRLAVITERFDKLETAFGIQVGETARKLAGSVFVLNFLITFVLMGSGILLTRKIVNQRVSAEASAQRARERLELATLSAHEGLWDWHIQSKQVYWTPRVPEMLGYGGRSDFGGYRVREQLHPEDKELAFRRLREHLTGLTERMEIDLRLRCRDKNYRWFRVRATALRNDHNESKRLLGTLTDVHSHKLAEQSLRSAWSQAQQMAGELELALNSADVALWAYEPETGNILHYKRWDTLLGRHSMPRTFEGWLQLTHPEDRQRRVRLLENHLKNKSNYYESEFRMLHADGSWVWVRSRGRGTARDHTGKALQYAGAVMNITAQVAAREVQRREKDFLQAMIEGVDLGVMMSDFDKVVYANRSLARLLEYEHEEDLSHEALVRLMPASDRAADVIYREKAAAGGVVQARVVRLMTRTQQRIKVVMNLSCVDWHGSPHFISTVSPLSEHADLEAHLQSAEDRFERAMMSELEAQQATIARELHDSLGSILTGISLLLRSAQNAQAEATRTSLLQRAQDQVQEAAGMTRAMARGIMPVGTHAGALVRALEQFVHDLDLVNGIRAKFDVEVDDTIDLVTPTVGNHVYRIVQEATSNAINGGKATALQITLREEGRCYEIAIEDNGIGFAIAKFEAGSPGLGIRSMKARAKAIRGSVLLKNNPEGGCTLVLSWPIPGYTEAVESEMDSDSSQIS
ncbi:MAG: PAS domain-containing protein [Ramlibacter sp.]|nr:PAS domain-containing protein [Ramlibacter sp.]